MQSGLKTYKWILEFETKDPKNPLIGGSSTDTLSEIKLNLAQKI